MANKKVIIVAIFSLVLLQKCKYSAVENSQKIISQELTYDSINSKSKMFNVDLETTIKFETNDIHSENYNNLSLVIGKSKFSLHPIIDSKKFDKKTHTLTIKFNTDAKFVSKIYKNDTLTNKILNSKIIINDGGMIEKDDSFELKSLILGYPANDKAPKYE